MKTNSLLAASVLAVGLATAPAFAEEIARPTPAPQVSAAPDYNPVEEPAVIDHVVYLAKLPAPSDLIKGAELKATPILRMDQTADRIVVVYQYAGGRTVTFAYTLLSTAGSAGAPVAPASSATYSVVAPSPAPSVSTTTVVYAEPPPVVYYSPRVRYYEPVRDFWSPFALGVGLGWIGGHGHGHGGWHGGHGHGHGWRR